DQIEANVQDNEERPDDTEIQQPQENQLGDVTGEPESPKPNEEIDPSLPVNLIEEGNEEDKETEQNAKPDTEYDISRSSTVSNIPIADAAVQAELKEADEKAIKAATLIRDMKKSIAAYAEKETLTKEDEITLEKMNAELKEKLDEFEEITKRIQTLCGLADLSSISLTTAKDTQKQTSVKPVELGIAAESKGTEAPGHEFEDLTEFISPEDKLPRVVVCGMQDQVPRIIVCDGLKKKKSGPLSRNACKNDCSNLMMSLTGRLTESYCLQERLASENADLEGARYTLEEALLCKDDAVDCLQKKIGNLQTEMRIVLQENSMLKEKLTQLTKYSPCPGSSRPKNTVVNYACSSPSMPQMRGPGDVGCRIQQCSTNTSQLECQLSNIEREVKMMQCELGQIQNERQQMEQQRKMIKTPLTLSSCQSPRDGSCNPQLRELREQYNRLKDDFENKVKEVASLRNENIEMRKIADLAREAQAAAEMTAQSLEEKYKHNELQSRMLNSSKEQMIEQEQQLMLAKQRFREASDELEELQSTLEDQSAQLDDYKNKYLQAQEQVEEQRRRIEMLEIDKSRISEQVNIELQRIKNQFQEQLHELTPLPDILTATQMKLSESQQKKKLAERSVEELSQALKEIANLQREMNDNRTSIQFGSDERTAMRNALENWEIQYNKLKEENTNMKANLARLEEASTQNQIRLQEKLHEITQLTAQLETVREESARQVSRTKDRSETSRRSLQNQIYELEKELAQSRASARSAQKDRDEIRQKMQNQINNLTESFDQAQLRIRNLQSHVNFLKTSYTDIPVFLSDNANLMITENVPTYGMDSCDCNF
ncbi:hypothetical protein L9F63_011850, partial [Diploptera punctata]